MQHPFRSMWMISVSLLCSFSVRLFSSCGHEESQVEACADSFAYYYFRWQFQKAMNCCDSSSYRWLRFAASQVTQRDVDSLRALKGDVTCSVNDVHFINDSVAAADVRVSNFLTMDTMGQTSLTSNETRFDIPMAYRNGVWKVHLRGLPIPFAGRITAAQLRLK